MSDHLDADLDALRAAPPRAPGGLEQRVWAGVEQARRGRTERANMLAVQAASVLIALSIGVAGGVLGEMALAQDVHEVSVFTADAGLAPSTLLGGHP